MTGDLVRVRTYKGDLRPQYLDPADDAVLQDATWLCQLTRDAVGTSRGELQDEIHDEAQVRPDHKVVKGLAKVLLDSATFDTDCAMDPTELRSIVFRTAAGCAPLAFGPNPFGRPTAADVLEQLADELGLTPDQILSGLYADRKEEQQLIEVGKFDPVALVHRYNVALVQAVLLKATSLTLTLHAPTAARVRQLLRYVKFNQLLHRASRDGDDLTLVIDGPEAVLKQSTRYGMKLATFFPAVLLQESWTLTADVRWKRNRSASLTVDDSKGLVSHYTDRGGYTPRVAQWFAERFEATETDWKLHEGEKPVPIDDQVVMPDFTLVRGRRRVHLEIVGYWRKDYLQRRLQALERSKAPLILAVSNKLAAEADALESFGGAVIPFAKVVPVKKVLEAAEAIIAQ